MRALSERFYDTLDVQLRKINRMSGLSGYRYGARYRYRVAQALDSGRRVRHSSRLRPLRPFAAFRKHRGVQILRNIGPVKLPLASSCSCCSGPVGGPQTNRNAVDATPSLTGLLHDQHGRSLARSELEQVIEHPRGYVRIQPLLTRRPTPLGLLVPWIRYLGQPT